MKLNNSLTSILVVEDDERIGKLLCQFLRSEGFAVHWVGTGEEGVDYIKNTPPHLVILDLMLPKMDGVEVCNQVRPSFENSILMLTAHPGDIEEVTALNAGVDDFMSKPIRTHVLLARINALIRRQQKHTQKQLKISDLLIGYNDRKVWRGDNVIAISDSEFELLWALASNAGSVVKREDLFQLVRGKDYDGLDRSIDMRISKLRKKLSAGNAQYDYIRTLRQQGYLFVQE
jgi:DNA-binding response OmpR family regulator